MADHRSVDVRGIRLAYQVSEPPDAPPLVLLHALGGNATDWEPLMPVLARSRQVYALDLRGHGRSDWPGDYSLELMRADVLRFPDALGLGRVEPIGHSMGGVVAYLLAQDHPHRVSRLVLEDVPAPRPREPGTPARPDGDLGFGWEMVPAVRRQIDRPGPRWLERLGQVTAETLVVAGGPRSHVPQVGVAESACRIPGGHMVTVPVGHLIHRAPEAFTEVVAALLLSRLGDHGRRPAGGATRG
ncbi:alpha/beta fold hydrolase [Streptomyces sp. NPDC094143]|uniref:alpha/beta fold hydrolase n=1 Tax=Streptomyces sp. NPDC094143 TaxID=3155310 RepID=UPI00331A13F9